jgi:hypothetical protein
MLYRWRRLDKDGQRSVWRLYGWYSALMVCGSCFGAATWVARMMTSVFLFKGIDAISNSNLAQGHWFVALAFTWRAAFLAIYAIEFLCLTAAKLMVLDRMSDFAAPQGHGMMTRSRWNAAGRAVMAVVVMCNAAGLAANVAAAIGYQQAAVAYSAASACYEANNNDDADAYRSSGRKELNLALQIASVQMFFEVTVLLLIVTAFVVVGVLSTRRVSSALVILDKAGPEIAAGMMLRRSTVGAAMALGRQFRKEVVATTGFVFVAFLLRSVTSTMLAFAFQLQDSNNICPGVRSLCDASCYNVYSHITEWNAYTPEFQPTVVLISSPLALLIALWGMTSKHTLKLMKTSQRQTAPLKTLQTPGSIFA